MRIRFTNPHGNFKAGAVTDLPDDQARKLIKENRAEEYDDSDQPARLRFRRSATIGGKTIAAGSVDSFEQSDEVWEAVNKGDADLDPAPGEAVGSWRQPFPPEWVNRDDTTEAPVRPVVAQPVQTARLATTATSADDLDAKTAAELHEIAAAENVEGRSGLNKDDLVKAIRKGRRAK
jgi:hypothetical protein